MASEIDEEYTPEEIIAIFEELKNNDPSRYETIINASNYLKGSLATIKQFKEKLQAYVGNGNITINNIDTIDLDNQYINIDLIYDDIALAYAIEYNLFIAYARLTKFCNKLQELVDTMVYLPDQDGGA